MVHGRRAVVGLTEAGFKEVTFRDAGVVVRDVEDGRREFPLFVVAATA